MIEKCAYEGCALDRWYLPSVYNPIYCILHSPEPKKDPKRFEKELEEKIRADQNDATVDAINLEGVVFPLPVAWRSRHFRKRALFSYARFLKMADFVGVVFYAAVDFFQAQFSAEANFRSTQFTGDANFNGAQFSAEASFNSARFWAARFGEAQFSADANFRFVEFCAAHFDDARFSAHADFSSTQFSGGADFRVARFSGTAYFFDAQLSAGTDFRSATFSGALRLRNTPFPTKADQGNVHFSDVNLEQPEKVIFEHVNLSRASFLRTDMSSVSLIDCAWPRREEPLLGWLPHFKDKIVSVYDHLALLEYLDTAKRNGGLSSDPAREGKQPEAEEGTENRYRLVENVYRQLKFNLESRKNYIEAGDFHMGEMEMRRLNPETPGHYRFFLEAYKFFAHYGESYFRPFFYWGAFGLLFAFLYLFSGFKVMEEPVQYEFGSFDLGAVPGFFWHFVQALAAALTVPPLTHPDFHLTSSWVAPFRSLNSLLIVILIALALIALRRRFKR